MKYLLVFYFAGFFLADAAQIKKYKLRLEPKQDEFQGTVTLTLSDSNSNNDVELDPYAYESAGCTYTGKKTENPSRSSTTTENPSRSSTATENPSRSSTTTENPSTSSTTTENPSTSSTTTENPSTSSTTTENPSRSSNTINPPEESTQEQRCEIRDNKIKFLGTTRTSEEVVLKFKGKYGYSGLSKHETVSNDRFYVADMTSKHHKIIFPCQEKVKAEFEFEGDGVVMSNLENLREKDERKMVFLRDLTFVQGDIVKDESITSFPYYRMKNSKEMGQKLKNVMKKVAELDPRLKILFTPISEQIHIVSRDVIILSGVELNPDDSGSDYSLISQELGKKLFQRPEVEKKTFFDWVAPNFAAMKISGSIDFPFNGYRKFVQIEGLKEDGFNNSKSINELASEDYVWQHQVVYAKGTSVLYALESICGDEKFTTGLSNYARNVNSKVNEVFEGCFANKDKATEFFTVWTDNPGYPVVHVMLNKPQQYGINQERFLWFGSEQKNQRWIIPSDYKTKEGSVGNIMLNKDNVTETINSTYFILDHNNKGFYRVNYDAKLWEVLISQLKSNHTEIDVVNRMKLIDDVFSFPKSTYKFNHGTPDYVTALKLSEYLKSETDSMALVTAFDALGFLDWALTSSYHGKFRDHMKGILNGIYDRIVNEDSAIYDRVIPLACKFGVEKCIKNATERFGKINWNTTELSRQEKSAICSVVRNDPTKWTDSFVLLSAMDIHSDEKNSLLACSRDEKILTQFLSQFIAKKNKQEFKQAVTFAMENNPDNIKVILDIIKRYEDPITKVFGKECLQEIVRLTLPKLNLESAATLKDIAKNLDKELQEEVNSVSDNVKLWTDTKAKSVGEYFKGSGSQAKPIALVLLLTTLLPLANHIFHS